MKKEVIFAILIGFSIGLIITYGIYRAQQSYQEINSHNNIVQEPPPTPSPSPIPKNSISITTPRNEAVIFEPKTIISGITSPHAYVTSVTNENEVITQADSSGNFSLSFPLEPNGNLITITSITESGDTAQENLFVTFTTNENAPTVTTNEEK